MKTTDEINAEITTLLAMKPYVRRYSHFNDDHHAAIDAQLRVLEDRMDEDTVYDEFEDAPQNVFDSAREAFYWMDDQEEMAPSENWNDLVEK